MAERELRFPLIDGVHYGGDQNWYRHWLMRMGGCSTTAACEACICLARERSDMRSLYPGDPTCVSKDDFIRFADLVFPHVHPDVGGLTDIGRFAAMLKGYAACCGADVEVDTLSGDAPLAEAEQFIRAAIDDGRPVSYLMLRHQDRRFDDFEWHWFSVTGYEETAAGMLLTAGTYGRRHRLELAPAWNTGFVWKGGLAAARGAA